LPSRYSKMSFSISLSAEIFYKFRILTVHSICPWLFRFPWFLACRYISKYRILFIFVFNMCFFCSLDSAVGIATGYGLNGWISCPGKCKNFLFCMSSRRVLVPKQPRIHWAPGNLSPVIERQGREADHSLQIMLRSRKIHSP
jgi:hypothetical protein